MAASTAGISLPVVAERITRPTTVLQRRSISPKSGRALELLSHAIEYLTDEYVQHAEALSTEDAELQAIQLLMELNRQVYFECPPVLTFAQRWRAFCRTFLP